SIAFAIHTRLAGGLALELELLIHFSLDIFNQIEYIYPLKYRHETICNGFKNVYFVLSNYLNRSVMY
ncbi:MAG TPA: hypothetical protein ACFYD9_09245, partial [Candidatus Wunengus sp. YC64]|uniref:hypothetical protein n=1 Tax=Candidatus Wunengus sp. YC64 TaxID=3367700 RepID=UPI004029A0B1